MNKMEQELSIIQDLIIPQLPAIFLAILTAIYVILTHKMLVQMRIAREPNIYLDIDKHPRTLLILIIGNSGLSSAKNVLIQCNVNNAPWINIPKGVLSNNKKMKISFITPGRKLHYFLGVINIHKFREVGGFISFIINYQGESGKKYKHEVFFDLGGYLSTIPEEFETPQSNIAKALQSLVSEKKSEKSFEQIRTRMGMTKKKVCPYCGELIEKVAKKCPRCLEFLDSQKSKSNKK